MVDTPRDPNTPTDGRLRATDNGAGPNTQTVGTVNPDTGETDPYNPPQTDPNAPVINNNINPTFNIVLPRNDDQIDKNPLNDYIDVIYNISLGMVSQDAYKKLQGDPTHGAGLSFKPGSDYIVFASTGDATTDPSYRGDYYNIRGYKWTVFHGHLPQNPVVAAYLNGTMTLTHPYGYGFREDMEDLADQLGYPIPLPMEFCYRIEVWFSGYSPSGEWVPRIEFPVSGSGNASSIIYYVKILTAEAKIDSTGSTYTLSFGILSELATRAEIIVMHQDQLPTQNQNSGSSSTLSYTQNDTFQTFVLALSQKLKEQIKTDTLGHVICEFNFIGPNWLMEEKFSSEGNVDFHSGVSYNDDSGSYAFSGNSVDIFTLLNHVMDALPIVRKLALLEENPEFTMPGTSWNFRPHVAKVDGADGSDTNSYTQYEFTYYIEPVHHFRFRQTEVDERNSKVSRSAQAARAGYMKSNGMVVRVYNYYFTNDNTEVIDFQIRLKNFYYDGYPYEGTDSHPRSLGHNTRNIDYTRLFDQDQQFNNEEDAAGIPADPPSYVITGTNGSGGLSSVSGVPSSPEGSSSSASPVSIQQHMHRTPHHPSTQHLGKNPTKAQKYLKHKDTYMRFEMVDSQITVRCDPVWLLSSFMAGGDFTPTLNEGGAGVRVLQDRAIYIRTFAPNQKNFMSYPMTFNRPKRTPILGGYYQVLHVTTNFEGGRMVQQLNLSKYTNQNYYEDFTGFDSGIQSGGSQNPGSTGVGSLTPDPNATGTL